MLQGKKQENTQRKEASDGLASWERSRDNDMRVIWYNKLFVYLSSARSVVQSVMCYVKMEESSAVGLGRIFLDEGSVTFVFFKRY